MNLLKHSMHICILLCTIPIQSKISMQNIQSSAAKLFSKNKQETVSQEEFKEIKQLELLCEHAHISIHTWKQSSAMVEIKKPSNQTQIHIDCLQYEDMLQIKAESKDKKSPTTININIIVPEDTSIKIALKQGNICIKNLSGAIQAQTDFGNIDIIDGSQDITAYSKRGNITVQRESMLNAEWISAISENGNVILQVPQHINSKILAEAKNGKIYSDILITLQSKTTKLTDEIYKQQRHQLEGSIAQNENAIIAGTISLKAKHGTVKIKNYV